MADYVFFWLGGACGGSLFLLGSYFVFRHVSSIEAEEETRAKRKAYQASIQRPHDPPFTVTDRLSRMADGWRGR